MPSFRPGNIAGVRPSALIQGTAFATLLVLSAPAVAGSNAHRQPCSAAQSFGNPACQTNAATVPRAYERWQDGSAAPNGGSTNPSTYSPNYYRGYNALYGFGR